MAVLPLCRLALASLLALLANLSPPAAAQSSTDTAAGGAQARAEALDRARSAMVAVLSEAVDEAGSIATLGALRRGSGVVIGDDGLVLTIGYLILEAERVDLVVEGARRVPARVVAYDLASGFGLLQALAPLRVAPVALGRSTSASGDEPLMVASGGAEGELSLARLVSQRAFSGYWEYHIDAALFTVPPRTDHSGAGLFNLDGELLGIGSLVVSDAMGPAAGRLPGNMFVPVDLLKPILAEMRARGASRGSTRAWLGLNCAESAGEVRVLRVTRESPAELAGVLPGDRILRIDGAEVGALETLYKTLWRDGAERDVQLTIRRGGDVQTLTVHALDRMKTLRKPQGI
ncbi:S1C family serine protease [Piscinibacter sp.]|jgi:serine protease Do|uniref:S1C family serine protease n=1 Tax=Piscinibacter sp. TaxID=1903157 RepID=UPI001D2FE23B|nr:S1C family serine protease [Piscinibacter sp.]MBK7532087.1 serine protease [Piscinibacter sp.]HPG80346.1 S1C family serine protease [Piscinibacter sp.]